MIFKGIDMTPVHTIITPLTRDVQMVLPQISNTYIKLKKYIL